MIQEKIKQQVYLLRLETISSCFATAELITFSCFTQQPSTVEKQ